ncbi:DNA replication complex GINS protein PSF1-like [Phymastichus coffea]|uniref:DNA replication complex GINS protein PSF1-like n=1 Tax=Phymastichus coffea TaxID=108790 RepID=UPI00273CA021|nr:DNA replication complex GINS protein PSF1-like [Phymastichus coffea]
MTTMFAKEAVKLIHELDQSDEIKPFNEAIFRTALEEIHTLYNENQKDANELIENRDIKNTLVVRHHAMMRNKRCLLAYLYHRIRRLRNIRWELGSIIPEEITKNLLPAETAWFQTYNKSLAMYMKSIGKDGLNIMNDFKPPKSLFVEVRCVKDYGKFELDDGQTVNLKENTYHLLPRSECEILIRQGILEHVIPS